MQYHLNNGRHQKEAGEVLRAGLDALGAADLGANVVACWGWRAGCQFHRMGKDVLVLERGYLGDRFSFTSIAWNGLNNRAEFPEYPGDRGQRLASLGVSLAPLRAAGQGDYVLLAGQVSGDMALNGHNLKPWYQRMAVEARQVYGLEVVFRPHPDEWNRKRHFTVKGC